MGALPGVFMILGNAVVLGVAGWRVMEGDMSLGMMMGCYVLATYFLMPIGRFRPVCRPVPGPGGQPATARRRDGRP